MKCLVQQQREKVLWCKRRKKKKDAFKADTVRKITQKNGKYMADYSEDPNYSGWQTGLNYTPCSVKMY